jgi:hypothetical protein
MASIYEKPPHFVLEKTWEEKTKLLKTYKLQSNDSCSKNKAKVHQDSGKLGVEFKVNKMISEFKKGAKKINFNYSPSPAAFTASTPTTCTKSAMPIRATKCITNHAQTTATKSAGMTATTMAIATPVATMSCAEARILPCPAMVMLARAVRAKPRRIFT